MAIQGPLTGVRVIELGNMVAPDTCTRMMADLGADVIKVENTALGDNFRVWPRTIGAPTQEDFNPIFDNLNANKKSISVNLKTKEGLDVMYQLLGKADIFITNVRTKGLEHMGLGYDLLREKFPKLVVGQLEAYGPLGPDKDKPGYDSTAFWARSGFMYGQKVEREGEEQAIPIYIPMGVGDIACASLLMGGCFAALLKARETGVGDRVSVPLYGAATYLMNLLICGSQYGYTFPRYRHTSSPFGAPFLCKDGRWFMPQVVNVAKDLVPYFKLLGLNDYLEKPEYCVRGSYNDPDFNRPVMERLDAIYLTKTSDEWCDLFRAADLSFEKLASYDEVLVDEQAIANSYVVDMEYPNGETCKTIRTPIRTDATGLTEIVPGPMLGENTVEILQDLGLDEAVIQSYLEAGIVKQHD